jgi:hypothetical protein
MRERRFYEGLYRCHGPPQNESKGFVRAGESSRKVTIKAFVGIAKAVTATYT